MKNFKRRFAIFLRLSICAALLIGGYFLYQNRTSFSTNPERFIQEREGMERLLLNSAEIHRIWEEGEESREWNLIREKCLKYYNIISPFDESLMRCNPAILQCYSLFSTRLNFYFIKPEINDQKNKKLYRYISKSNSAHIGIQEPGYLFTIEDKISHKRLNLLLGDQCHEVFLQNRIYAYGEEVIGKHSEQVEDYRFDNFNQNIYIDRHLVVNSEINDWIDFGNPNFTEGLKKIEADNLFMPATNLTYSQMENFCSFKGKQIMQAHYFDAATFLPMNIEDTTPSKNSRAPYYWSKKKSDFKEDCTLIYAKNCLGKKRYRLNLVGPTWAGIMDPMGGVFEVFRNPIDPESNLKASSYYFNFKSPWHKLGFRAGWDGDGFEFRHFDFKGINPEHLEDEFKVGFRCMRESI